MIKAWLFKWLRQKLLGEEIARLKTSEEYRREQVEKMTELHREVEASKKEYDRKIHEIENLEPDIRSIMVDTTDYEPMDRYRDFVKTFNTKHGERVLTQILIWGRVNKSVFATEPTLMAFKEGERNLALKIVAGLTQPVDLPTEQKRRDK